MTLLTPKDNEPSTVRVGGTAPAERQPTAFELAFQKAKRQKDGLKAADCAEAYGASKKRVKAARKEARK